MPVGEFQRHKTPYLFTHIVKLSARLPKSSNPQKIPVSCLDWDEEAMVLQGSGSVIKISYKKLAFIILKDHTLVSKMYR
jgi:hypothetical protein